MRALLKMRRWEGGRGRGAGENQELAGVALAFEGPVCSPEILGGLCLSEKRSGVVLGFFHWTQRHTPVEPDRGAVGAAQAHPTSLGSRICSNEEKRRPSVKPPPTLRRNCNSGGLPRRSGCAPPPPNPDESLPLCGCSALLHTSAKTENGFSVFL